MEIKLLPANCYPGRSIRIEGLAVHFTSGISKDVEPNNPFDPEVVWRMLHDLNLPRSGRKYYPNCEGIARSHASYNELIGRERGESLILVPFGKETYHAGVSLHKGRSGCNKFMASAALIGTEESGFTDWQYERLAQVAADQRAVNGFQNDDIAGHDRLRWNARQAGMKNSEGKVPDWKLDPSGKADGTGENFDWPRFYSMVDELLERRRKLAQA
jgi:N-acetyl-anhydromuramyl-L-alanine amidase AmpD